jgi:4-amino-4-deoxy-L-arabinose transferase-like glycosyltransferase
MKVSTLAALLSTLLVGTALRLYDIGFQCYWTEELHTIQLVGSSISHIISRSMLYDFTPPTYYLIVKAVSFFVETPEASRYTSAAFGIALILAMYYVGKEMYSELSGLYCAGITAVLFPLVYYSRFGRTYELVILVFAIAFLYYIRIKNGEHSNTTIIAFAIAAGACMWVHLFAIVPIALMTLDVYITTKKRGSLYSVVIASPLVISMYSILRSRGTDVVDYGMHSTSMVILTPYEFFGLLWPFFIPSALAGMIVSDINYKKELAIIVGVTIIFGIICSFFTPMFVRYYLMLVIIPIMFASVLLAKISDKMFTEEQGTHVAILFMLIILVIQYPTFFLHYTSQKYVC